MSDQNQLNKKEQPLENTTQTADNENVPSASNVNAEFKENDFSEEEMEKQKIWLRSNQEEHRGDQLRADLKEPRVQQETSEAAGQKTSEAAGQESSEAAGQESSEAAGQESSEAAGQESSEAAGQESSEAAGQESSEAAGQESPEAALQKMPESRERQSKADQKDQREDLKAAQQERPESRGHDLRADLKEPKEDLMVDVVPARKVGPEAERKEGPEAARKEGPEPPQTEIQKPEPTVGNLRTLGTAAVVVLIAIWLGLYFSQFHGTQTSDSRSALQIFQDQFKSLQKDFPKQSQDLWLRSEKMLRNHLNKSEPHEPATIILTAAQDAKHTLLCLGSGLAQTYAASHNAKWLVIHGPSESEYDHSTAKLHIDEKLSSGFQSEYRAAVLNRLETLPPGSLLILYKYCDHENAAYKNVALVLTVLLADSSLEADISLPELEEKVRDFLWQQFISSSTIRSHMEMDSDKLGGVWSRISHLVLPVVPVESIEVGHCPFDHEGT